MVDRKQLGGVPLQSLEHEGGHPVQILETVFKKFAVDPRTPRPPDRAIDERASRRAERISANVGSTGKPSINT
jgi:hypothetical protein